MKLFKIYDRSKERTVIEVCSISCVSVDQRVDDECGAADALDSARAAELLTAERDVHGDQTLDGQQTNQERRQMAQVDLEKVERATGDSAHFI